MEEAPEPQEPEPQNRTLQDPQNQAQMDHQEDTQLLREEGQKGPQSYPSAEEWMMMDQAEEGSLHSQTQSQRQLRQNPRDRQRS